MVNAALLLLSGSLRSLCHFIFAPGLLYIPYALVRGRDLELNVYKYHQDTSLSLESERGYYSILKCSKIRARSQMPAPLTAPQKAHGCAQHKGTQPAMQPPPAHTAHKTPALQKLGVLLTHTFASSPRPAPAPFGNPAEGSPKQEPGGDVLGGCGKPALGSCSCDARTSQLAFYSCRGIQQGRKS